MGERVVQLYAAGAIEPVTLSEIKQHLRINSGAFSDYISSEYTLKPDAYPVTPLFGIIGATIDVLNTESLVTLVCGTVAGAGTLDVKIQESDTGAAWADWPTGAFAQVTAANDDATYEKAYTGVKRYIRTVATVAVDIVEFGVNIIKGAAVTVDDTMLTEMVKTARKAVEDYQGRAFITQDWDLWLDEFPSIDTAICLPRPPVQSITHIKYYDTANLEYTMAAVDYFVDANIWEPRVVPAYGTYWPTTELREIHGVNIRVRCGYGLTAATVPPDVKQAIKMLVGHYYERREHTSDSLVRSVLHGAFDVSNFDRRVPL
jgi:uncharacterized phiE125 gp8 family phage protein